MGERGHGDRHQRARKELGRVNHSREPRVDAPGGERRGHPDQRPDQQHQADRPDDPALDEGRGVVVVCALRVVERPVVEHRLRGRGPVPEQRLDEVQIAELLEPAQSITGAPLAPSDRVLQEPDVALASRLDGTEPHERDRTRRQRRGGDRSDRDRDQRPSPLSVRMPATTSPSSVPPIAAFDAASSVAELTRSTATTFRLRRRMTPEQRTTISDAASILRPDSDSRT